MKSENILITAGPTYEAIDAVRYIGNYSSGKMGYDLAEACAEEGANVILVSGPVSFKAEHPSIKVIPVNSAADMYEKCHEHSESSSIIILSAAVADYTPEETFQNKIKRAEKDWVLTLKPTRDIAATLGKKKESGQILVGFALETDNELENAKDKLKKKNLDLIVLNSLRDKGAGFGGETNKITLIDKNNNIDNFELKSKKEVARDIVNKIIRIKENA